MSDFLSFLQSSTEQETPTVEDIKPKAENVSANVEQQAKALFDRYAGKSEAELMSELDAEIQKRKSEGGISSEEINSYVNMLSPFLGERQKGKLDELIKKIN